jgi:hypothetical protein
MSVLPTIRTSLTSRASVGTNPPLARGADFLYKWQSIDVSLRRGASH